MMIVMKTFQESDEAVSERLKIVFANHEGTLNNAENFDTLPFIDRGVFCVIEHFCQFVKIKIIRYLFSQNYSYYESYSVASRSSFIWGHILADHPGLFQRTMYKGSNAPLSQICSKLILISLKEGVKKLNSRPTHNY